MKMGLENRYIKKPQWASLCERILGSVAMKLLGVSIEDRRWMTSLMECLGMLKKTRLFYLKWATIFLMLSIGWGGLNAFWETGNTPTQIAIQTMVSSPTGPINGIYSVEVQLYNGSDPTSAEPIGVPISYRSIRFVAGLVNLVVDIREMVPQEVFYGLTSPHLKLTVNNDAVYLPLYSVPYAIQSRSADMARKVSAAGIVGTFPDLSINAGLVVGPNATPYFKVTSTEGGFPKVGINVSSINDNATLDVGGIVNAQGYRIDGQDIDVALLWNKTPASESTSIYYNQGPTGFVGIGLSNPAYMLDVAGTVNAKAFTVNGISIETYLQDVLPWTTIDRNVYRFGDVGIGISNPTQRLDVAGAIRIRESRDRAAALPGTIEYRLDPLTGRGDFWGYTGASWESLTKDQGNGVPGSLAYWGSADRLESAVKNNRGLWWDPDRFRFGIGLQANMDSVLTIEGQGESDLMHVKDAIGNPVLYVSNSNVGIGTSKPGQAYKLDVNGIINVQKVYISGRPLETALSSDSYWLLENDGRIFYDRGRVGIGTTNPANLLEISSKTGESAITFGIQSARLFTMGISDQNPESFIIATSGNLNVPVFAFKNQNIGIGVPNPRANFHVSGNSGVVIKGQFGVVSGFTETGEGAKLFWFPGKAAFRAGLVRNDGWDPYKLGNYSVGIGYNPIVSANYGVGLGGYNNVVLGEGAVAIGGISNLAQGAYSFAGGYQAQALHTGSFVWADYTPTANPYFASTRPNQFLIRAGGGVGIGTSNTSMGMLTVANPNRDEYVFGAFGVANFPVMLVTTSGNVGFGVRNPGTASVALPLGAKIGIGTTQPTASITVLHSENTNTQYFRLTNRNADPIMVVGRSGLVGFGVDPDTMTDAQRGDSNVFFSGGIRAEKFVQLVVEEGIPKEIEIQAYASPWNDPSKNQGNTYFTEGNVGIGTPSPNNLLELSNRSSSGGVNLNILPRLAFDIYGQDQFSLGLVTSSVLPVINMLGFFHSTSSNPILSISQSGVGINLGRAAPISAFQVSGNVRVDRLWVGDPDLLTGVETNIPLTVRGAMSVDNLYINGAAFVPAVSFWSRNGMHIYTTNNVGIGTTSPIYPLDINGVIRTSGLLVTQPLLFNGAMSVDALQLIDQVDTSKLGVLRVRNGDLQFVNPLGETRILSSSLKQGVGNIGDMAYFVNESTIGKSAIAWNGDSNLLTINGRMDLRGGYQSSGLISTTSVQMVLPTMGMYIQSDLKNEGDASLAKSYTLANYVMNINSTWGSSGAPVDLTGINLNMINLNNSYVLNGSRVVGLAVDVSGVNLEQGSTAEKYAALFNGGFVGVGTTKPSVELEVNGTISANYFSLRGGLSVPTLRVTGGRSTPFFVATYKETGGVLRPRIGIGLSNPEDTNFELSVAGAVSVNQLLISGGLTATTLNIANNAFVVASNGRIGIGNSNPDSQLSVRRMVSSLDQSNLVATQFDTVIDGATQAGNIFYFDKDIKGMSVEISSLGNSNLSARGVGLNIDLSSLKISTGVATAKAYGLYVDVSGTGDRVAGAFMGGNVGIGVSNPQATLHVDGSIRAQGLIVSGTLDASAASITLNEMLVNHQLAVAGLVSANNLNVSNYATFNALTVSGTLAIDTISMRELNTTTVLVTTSVLTGGITASVATINLLRSQSLRIGGSTLPVGSAALAVTGNSIFDSMNILGTLSLLNATLNVQSGTLMVTNQSRRVGIGTSDPQSVLHVMSGSLGAYNANEIKTWAPVVIQSQGTAGMASGVLLSTDSWSNGQMPDSGAGIVALLGNGDVGQLGTSLLFITDPGYGVNASVPLERIRITPSGLVGIGLTNPSNMLDIAGGLTVQGDVVVNTANISVFDTQGDPLQINAANVQFSSMALFSQGITVNRVISFYPTLKPAVNPLSGQLYVNQANKDLYYLSPLGEDINLSSIYSGPPTVIPYIDQSGSIASNMPLYWFDDRRLFQIGTKNTDTKMVIVSSYNATITGNVSLLSLRSVLPDFTTSPLSRTLTGLDINLSGESSAALGANDTAIGLNVDVRPLSANRFYSGAMVSAMKYAATFLGGNVGIGLTNPNAALHIVQENASTPLFRMDTTNSSRFIEVSATGTLGINTSNVAALLSIVSPGEAGLRSLWVGNSARTQFVIDSLGQVGVGISFPQAMLHVEQDIKANAGYFDWVSTNILMVGKQALVVSQNGLVGIGTSNPMAQLDVVRNIGPSQFLSGTTDFLGSSFSMMRVLFQMTDNTPSTKRFYRGNVTGLDVVIDSGASSFGSALQTVEVTGIKLDATKVIAQGTAPITGLNVDVSGSGGVRRSAIFMGGNVGIGITNPSYALDVSGNVNINGGIVVSGEVSANRVTVDQLLVRQNIIIGGTISANVLRASTINVTSLVLTKEVISGTSRFSTINATVAVITTLNVGGEQIPPSTALFVSGDVVIKGIATIGILRVSTINVSPARPLMMAGSGTVVMPTVSVTGPVRVTGSLQFNPVLVHPNPSERAQLYFKDNALYLLPPGSSQAKDLTASSTGNPGSFGYYNTSGELSSLDSVKWDSNQSIILIGSSNQTLRLKQETVAPNNNAFIGSQYMVNIPNRLQGSGASQIVGVSVGMDSINGGRLGQGDTLVGLYVDVSGVNPIQTAPGGATTTAHKLAAAFLGGSVAIGTLQPSASLHIIPNGSVPRLLAGNNLDDAEYIIDELGRVGLGTGRPSASLTILQKAGGSNRAMWVQDESGNPSFVVQYDGKVGVKQANPSVELDINGTVVATTLESNLVSANTMRVGGFNVDDANGLPRLSFGGPISSTYFSVSANTEALFTTPYTLLNLLHVLKGSAVAGITHTYSGSVTGMNLTLQSNNNADFSGTATGLSIDTSQINQGTGRVTGITVTTPPNGIAALLMGKVGIGVTPNSDFDLSVSGTVSANRVSAQLISSNRLITSEFIADYVTVNQYLYVPNMTVGHLHTNALEVSTLRVVTVNFENMTASNFNATKMGINTPPDPAYDLLVNGSAKFNNLSVSSLTVSNINVSTNSVLVISGNVRLEVPELRVSSVNSTFISFISTLNSTSQPGQLWVSPNNHLYFRATDSIPYAITEALQGPTNALAYFGPDGRFTADPSLTFANNTLTIGSATKRGELIVAGRVDSSQSNYTALVVTVNMGDRSAAPASNIMGMKIEFGPSGNSTARLAAGETAIGLVVDMRSVSGEYTSTAGGGGDPARAYKTAALFTGGAVGIGVTQPTALLDVVATTVTEVPLRIRRGDTTMMVVSSNGYVGVGVSNPLAKMHVIGTGSLLQIGSVDSLLIKEESNTIKLGVGITNPAARLHIKGVSGTDPLMKIANASGATQFLLDTDGNMGVGTSNPLAKMHIVAQSGVAALWVGSDMGPALVVTNNRVGVGVSQPSANLHVKTQLLLGTGDSFETIDQNLVGLKIASVSNTLQLGYVGNNAELMSTLPLVIKRNADTLATFDTYGLRLGDNQSSNSSAPLKIEKSSGVILDLIGSSGSSTPIMRVYDNYILINTSNRVASNILTVGGDVQINGGLTATTVTAQHGTFDKLTTSKTIDASSDVVLNQIVATNTLDQSTTVTGLKIELKASQHPLLDREYTIFGEGKAIGLYADVSNINNAGQAPVGSRYAAIFSGGNVGIGVTNPSVPLEILGEEKTENGKSVSDLLYLKYSSIGSLFRAIPAENLFSWRITDGQSTGNAGITFKKNNSDILVGIATDDATKIDKALVVNGDMRLGTTTTSGFGDSASNGNKLYFSGGPQMGSGSQNKWNFYIGRYNQANTKSILQIAMDPESGSDKAAISFGHGNGAGFKSYLRVSSSGNVKISEEGEVLSDQVGTQKNTLLVEGNRSNSEPANPAHFVVQFTNRAASGHLLGLVATPPSPGSSGEVKFISFFNKSGTNSAKLYGYISGDYDNTGTMNGIRFVTQAADYAEYLPKLNGQDQFNIGDVVGVENGRVTHRTDKAQVVLVRSYAATIAGNMPPRGQENDYLLTAFLGQVKVRVLGSVKAGQYIVASQRHDGTAIAVDADALTPDLVGLVVGIAWESNDNQFEKLVLTAVGGPFSVPTQAITDWIREAKTAVNEARLEQARVEAALSKRMDALEQRVQSGQ